MLGDEFAPLLHASGADQKHLQIVWNRYQGDSQFCGQFGALQDSLQRGVKPVRRF